MCKSLSAEVQMTVSVPSKQSCPCENVFKVPLILSGQGQLFEITDMLWAGIQLKLVWKKMEDSFTRLNPFEFFIFIFLKQALRFNGSFLCYDGGNGYVFVMLFLVKQQN